MRPHTMHIVRDLLAQKNINVLAYQPAVTPNESLIKNIWYEMKYHLHLLSHQPVTLIKMSQVLFDIWNGISQASGGLYILLPASVLMLVTQNNKFEN